MSDILLEMATQMYAARRKYSVNEFLPEHFTQLTKTTQNRYLAMAKSAYDVLNKTMINRPIITP